MATPAAGDVINASDVIRARTKWFGSNATGTLAASQTNIDIPGISISFTTETASADIALFWSMDADPASGGTTLISARPRITDPTSATTDAPVYAVYQSGAGNSGDRGSTSNTWKTALGAAGNYTITLKGNTGASEIINLYTSLTVAVQEQFS